MSVYVDPFPARWDSLTEVQRRFLLAAYEMERLLPHSSGMDKLLPPVAWRTAGLMCDLKPEVADALVPVLAELRLVLVLDAEKHQMALISRHEIRELLEARWRRRWNWVVLAAGLLAAAAGALWGR